MAICKTSLEIKSIRGRFGGVYFKHDNAGQHVQTMPRTVSYTRTGDQGAHRDAWTNVADYWKALRKTNWPKKWKEYADRYLYRNKKGEETRLSAWEWFTHYNVPRDVKSLPMYTMPPYTPHWLPTVVTVGDWFGIVTVPGYQSKKLINGRYYYYSDYMGTFIYWKGEGWQVHVPPGFGRPEQNWYKAGETITGIYNGVPPTAGTVNVNR